MKELVLILLVFILMAGGVHADGEWGDISSGENSGADEVLNENVSDEVLSSEGDAGDLTLSVENSGEAGKVWTQNFYIALGVGTLGLLIVGLFIYLFLRGPKNKWKH